MKNFSKTVKTAQKIWGNMKKEEKGNLLFCDLISFVAKGVITEANDAKVEGTYNIVAYGRKGLKVQGSGPEFWIMKKWLRADGTLTPAGVKAEEKAKAGVKVKKYESVKFSAILRETDKAILLRDFESREAWVPKSATAGYDEEGEKSVGLWVAEWVCRQKGICGRKTKFVEC